MAILLGVFIQILDQLLKQVVTGGVHLMDQMVLDLDLVMMSVQT